ncbi:UNVERIFIED_CONTAM: hypothetical protein FKN15_051178 [Acipenser sinensis]
MAQVLEYLVRQQALPSAPTLAPPPALGSTPPSPVVAPDVSEQAVVMSKEEQDAISMAASLDGDSFPQQETEIHELTQEMDLSSGYLRDWYYPSFKLSSGAYGVSLQVPPGSWKAASEQRRSVFRTSQASTPQPFPVFPDFLKEVYTAEAQITYLANMAGLLMAYLDSILQLAPLPEPVDTKLRLVSGTLLQVSGFQGQALGRSLAGLVVACRKLWLSQAKVPDTDKSALLDAPISPVHAAMLPLRVGGTSTGGRDAPFSCLAEKTMANKPRTMKGIITVLMRTLKEGTITLIWLE